MSDMNSNHSSINGSVISFKDIYYAVDTRTGPICCSRKIKKDILYGVSGIMKPGMNAILGPTGSGKSSLLDVLAGRKDPRFLHGEILIDGHKQPENFNVMSGYVVQDDVVMGTLTVRENLAFSAALRLPKTVTSKHRQARVQSVIRELSLEGCADTKVGTEFIRGVSGGERKRTNIGMELIIRPTVLFLDEPTTGLDASTANAVMGLLTNMAKQGRTIIFSIHQPRYSIYKMIDSLMLLGGGQIMYHGPSKEILEYFARLGYICEEHNNPPDFFLDVINGDSTAVSHQDAIENVMTSSGVHVSEDVAYKLASAYENSNICRCVSEEVSAIHEDYHQRVQTSMEVSLHPIPYQTSFCTQWAHVSRRTVMNLWRNPQTSVLQLFVTLVLSLIVGLIFFQLDNDLKAGVQNRVGAFFFITMNMVFNNLSAVELFIKERAIFLHESTSGFYRVSAYFLAKIFCDVIPMRTIPTTIYCVVVYFMAGFQMDVVKFFIFYLILLLTTLCASCLAFFFSSLSRIFAIANLLIALTFVLMMIFSGFFINLTTMVFWLRWLRYLSMFRYSLAALSINELKDMEFCNRTLPVNATCLPAGNAYLDIQGIAYQHDWDLWQNPTALGSITIIFIFFTYLRLRLMNKYK